MTIETVALLALRITVILGAAATVNTVRRRASAGSRHWLWMFALAGTAVIPLAERAAPRMPILPWSTVAAPSTDVITQTAQPQVAVKIGATAAVVSDAPVEAAQSRVEARSPITPGTAIVMIWAIGAMIFIIRLVRAHVVALRVVKRSTKWSSPVAIDVPVMKSSDVELPFTYGFWSPVIVLPDDASSWSSDALASTLLHEQAHANRRDGIALVISQTIRALYWWHPVVWHAVRSAAAERERACDDAVLREGIRPSEYGNHLLKHAESAKAWNHGPLATVMFGHSAGLGARVMALLDPAIDRSSAGRPRIAVVAGMFALVSVVGAASPRLIEKNNDAQFVTAAMVPVVSYAQPPAAVARIKQTRDESMACRQAQDTRKAKTYRDSYVRITGAGSSYRDGVMRQIWTGTDCVAWIEYSGSVDATADETNMVASSDGKLIAHVDRDGNSREYRVSAQSASMTLNGSTVAIGASEREWIADMTREFLRRTGLRARTRALAALSRGTRDLLAEVALMPSGQRRVEYLREGFAATRDPQSAASFIREGAALLDSSDARAAFLTSVPQQFAGNLQVLEAIYREASVIEPDSDVDEILKTFEPPRPVPQVLAPFIDRMIAGMQSVERRTMLRAYYLNVRP